MAITSAEPVFSVAPRSLTPRPRSPRWRALLKWVAFALVCLWLLDLGISLLIQHSRLNRVITSRLEAAFGRHVDVKRYSLSLWTGPVLKADSITVGEDPRFGQEYFLRAESLTFRLRWRSLFSRHLELATISLSHPSLNLVRDTNGDWNLAEWLPRPASAASSPPGAANLASTRSTVNPLRFRKIYIDSGRINFKRGDVKLPFAFVDVGGTAETESPGLWRLDLVAVPTRAAVIAQQPGVLHLAGHLGGTSSRLRPAAFELAWDGASITDVLRLARNRDYGVRGDFGFSLDVRAQGDSWLLQGKAFLTQLHRWNLALRPDNPGINLVAAARIDPTGSRLEFTQARIELAHSTARVTGALDWNLPGASAEVITSRGAAAKNRRAQRTLQARPISPDDIARAQLARTQLRIASDAIDLNDVLAWGRAFHAGIVDGTTLTGSARLDMNISGWPPRVDFASLALPRAELHAAQLRVTPRLGPLLARYDSKQGIELPPATVTLGSAANSFRIDGAAKPDLASFTVHVQGAAAQLHDAAAAADQLGWNLARGWDISGPARCDLRWQGAARPWRTMLSGSIDWGTAAEGVSVHPQFLNLPVEQLRAHSDFKPGATHTVLSSAQAFGAHWTGTLDHDLSDGWQFAATGDSVSAADLDRWLNPRWHENFLDRLLPFLGSRVPRGSASDGIRARGRITLDEFALAHLATHRLRADLLLDGRRLDLSNVEAQFYRGGLSGSLHADLLPVPKYETSVDLDAVDLRALAADFPSLANTVSGAAAAKIAFNFRGATRADLVDSLECRGTAHFTDAAIAGFTLAESPRSAAPPDGRTFFRDASAAFTCAAAKIQFQDLLLSGPNSQYEGAGTVDFARNLDFRFHPVPVAVTGPHPAKLSGAPADEVRVRGTLNSPQVTRVAAPVHSANAHP